MSYKELVTEIQTLLPKIKELSFKFAMRPEAGVKKKDIKKLYNMMLSATEELNKKMWDDFEDDWTELKEEFSLIDSKSLSRTTDDFLDVSNDLDGGLLESLRRYKKSNSFHMAQDALDRLSGALKKLERAMKVELTISDLKDASNDLYWKVYKLVASHGWEDIDEESFVSDLADVVKKPFDEESFLSGDYDALEAIQDLLGNVSDIKTYNEIRDVIEEHFKRTL